MDYFSKLAHKAARLIFLSILLAVLASFGVWSLGAYLGLTSVASLILAAITCIVLIYLSVHWCTNYLMQPLKLVSEAIMHVAPGHQGTPAPNLDKSRLGKELVSSLAMQVYQLASASVPHINAPTQNNVQQQATSVLDAFPIPILVADRNKTISYANVAAAQLLDIELNELEGKNLYALLDLSFSSDDTLDTWLTEAEANTVTDNHVWERVQLVRSDQTKKQCDIAAHYTKNSPVDAEVVVTLFDKTKAYGKDDDDIAFIALAVHELRTPLTMLRGYIEVFDEELSGKLDPELADFMKKMQASSQQLSTFVSNILNVARVEENQLFLQLNEENWREVIKDAAEDIRLNAQVHGKQITFKIDPNLPTVAADKVSMYEVINNLLDNAIKYSAKSKEIIVTAKQRDDGMIETTVQDFGIGIPSSIIGNLFEKFYRNHRSRAHIGGTGLGLYLSKAIVTAHGGQIWVQSKEGEGSTFGFTLQPYAEVAKSLEAKDNKGIVRTAHGWIKNHSFYRR